MAQEMMRLLRTILDAAQEGRATRKRNSVLSRWLSPTRSDVIYPGDDNTISVGGVVYPFRQSYDASPDVTPAKLNWGLLGAAWNYSHWEKIHATYTALEGAYATYTIAEDDPSS